jgi:hypothetical protein
LIATGNVDCSAAAGQLTVTGLSIPMTKGKVYWFASLFTGSTAPTRAYMSASPVFTAITPTVPQTGLSTVGFSQSGTTSALPTTWTGTTLVSLVSCVWIGY